MKKNIKFLIPLLLLCYSCVPLGYPIPEFAKTKIQFNGDFSNADKVEVIVKDTNCSTDRPCTTQTFILDPKNTSIQVIPGSKSITIVQSKDGKIISQNNFDQTSLINKDLAINVNTSASPVSSSQPTVSSEPTSSASTNNPSSTPSNVEVTSTPIVTVTSTPTSTAIPTPTVSPTATPNGSGGNNTGGSFPPNTGGGGISTPDIKVSATVAPDNTGVN